MSRPAVELLDALADGPATGADLAGRLGCSRAAVREAVTEIREAGFDLAGTDEGYALRGVPEYGGLAIEYGLAAPYAVEFHDSLDSTNARARELAAAGESDVAVVAAEQTGGRGRLDREWASPRGGVWLSVLAGPDLAAGEAPLVTLAAAVAVARAAREVGAGAVLKWPNDVLGGSERKLAGILTRMEADDGRVRWVVAGIGVNANVDAADLPEGATSLRALVGDVDRRAFVQDLLERFHALLGDPDAVLPAWRDLAVTPGRQVRVTTPGGTVEGRAVEVVPPGTLVVETGSRRVHVTAGDCRHLRRA